MSNSPTTLTPAASIPDNGMKTPDSHTFLDELTIDHQSIPHWAKELTKLGIKLSDLIEQNNTQNESVLNLAVSLPTRSYASTLVNLGLQIGLRSQIIKAFDEKAYFESLSKLPIDSEVYFYDTKLFNRNAKKRIFKGLRYEGGKAMILLQDPKRHGSSNSVGTKSCHGIIKVDQQRVTSLLNIKDFLQFMNGDANSRDAIAYTLSSDSVVAIIGKSKRIEEEHKLHLGQSGCENQASLTFNEIARLGTQTLLLSLLRDETCETLNEKRPPVVMYEGLSSTIKYQDAYTPIVRIFILDRQEPSSNDYRSELKARYASREAEPAPLINVQLPGVETLTYYSAD